MKERRKNQPGRGERRKADATRIADALKRRGRVSLYVQGTSMEPLVQAGDVALIRRDRLENMRQGDVVLFQRGNHLMAKRIGEDEDVVSEFTFMANADSLGDPEEKIEPQECLGKIVRVRRNSEEIELNEKAAPLTSLVSFVLKPARWAKGTLGSSEEASQ